MDKVKLTGVEALLPNVIVSHVKSKWPMIAVASSNFRLWLI
jgi:hypothetical protein